MAPPCSSECVSSCSRHARTLSSLTCCTQFADTPDQKVERRHRNRKLRAGGATKADHPHTVKGRYDPLGPHPPNRTPSPSGASPFSIALTDNADSAVPYYPGPYGLPYSMPPIMGPSLPIPSLSSVRSIFALCVCSSSHDPQEGVPQYTLYVTNLSATGDEGLLYQIFAVYGAILSVKVARTISGQCKGYAFVNFLRFEVRHFFKLSHKYAHTPRRRLRTH